MQRTKIDEQLLRTISSDSARIHVMERLIEKDKLDIDSISDRNLLRKAFELYQKNGEFGFWKGW